MYLITIIATKTNAEAVVSFWHTAPITSLLETLTVISQRKDYGRGTVACMGRVSSAINTGDNWGNAYALSSDGSSIVIHEVMSRYNTSVEIASGWTVHLSCREV